MERWLPLAGFRNYLVSEEGFVRHENNSQDLACLVNTTGVVYVTLWQDGKRYSRGLARLVAQTFLPEPEFPHFDTPINLNGDGSDNRVTNLMWRPRWFAVKYHKQFDEKPKGFRVPIVDLDSGERFPTSWEAAIKFGLLDHDILKQTLNHQRVFPTNQLFEPEWRNATYLIEQ